MIKFNRRTNRFRSVNFNESEYLFIWVIDKSVLKQILKNFIEIIARLHEFSSIENTSDQQPFFSLLSITKQSFSDSSEITQIINSNIETNLKIDSTIV